MSDTREELIEVLVNGDARQLPAGMNVTSLLDHLRLSPDRVAIERNLDILPRAEWNRTPVASGDRFEIVHLVGGG
jgi:thiamine biosynthesis protein ThiS